MKHKLFTYLSCLMLLLLATTLIVQSAWAQASTSTGSIQGVVTDASGAVLPDAKVSITSLETGQLVSRVTNSSGNYTSGPLHSGMYKIRIEAKKFQSLEMKVQVEVGVITAGSAKLTVGSESQTVEVTADAIQVNTEQNTVQGVLSSKEIANLPVNGRNFLDLAQLEPGVQIQDGGNFDPTKNGFSSISFGGRAGRTARITVDGIDVSDETVGTTTQNLSASAIGEFQVSQSSLDISTGLTSSGSVNVVTKSGSNSLHGTGFYNFRDKNAWIANFPGGQDNYFQRNQFGGNLGGPILKNKLFWFLSAERVKQATLIPINTNTPFEDIPGGYNSPFKDTTLFGRMDYNAPRDMRFFYRINYNWNSDVAAYGSTYQPFANRDNTPSQGVGWDWSVGKYTHSIRYGYLKFQNHIADAVLGSGVYNPAGDVPVAIRIGSASSQYRFGPSRLAPQATFQQNNEIKYDGSANFGSHLLRYGFAYNAIRGGGFASFYNWPELRSSSFNDAAQLYASGGPYPGGSGNPLNYKLTRVILGNGQGYATEFPAFGYPAGGQYDNRIQFYIGDTWKIKSNLTLIFGLRYNRDTGRTDSDLPPITCDQIPQSTLDQLTPEQVPCTGKTLLLDQFGGNYGGSVNQPNLNFGPTFGFSWDPWKTGKTSIRGGIGIYYENAVFNNVLFDRPVRLTQGLFNLVPTDTCSSGSLTLPTGTVYSFPYQGGSYSLSDICGNRIGDMMDVVVALQQYYQEQTLAGGAQANGGFVGAGLTSGVGNIMAPNYKTPYSIQMNIGIQRELWQNTVLSVDFLRNVGMHYLLAYDTNHVGDTRYFNKAAAESAIADTLAAYEVGTIDEAILAGATMEDFAYYGLGSGSDIGGGLPASLAGYPNGFAFGGINPKVGSNGMLFPNGRSTYTALQVKFKTQKSNPFKWMTGLNAQVSYTWSRFNTMADDQDFVSVANDYANPGRFYGPSALDRTSQLSFGAVFNFKRGPQISMIGHLMSPLAVTPYLVNGFNYGEIYYTDLTGDGTGGDIVTGSDIGGFGRQYKGNGINTLINNFNSQYAGKPTPAGQLLIDNGLFTANQLALLGAVISPLRPAPPDQASLGWLRTFDFKFSYPIKLGEHFTLTPSVGFYNAFNITNYDASTAPGSILDGLMDGSDGSINGTARGSSAHPRAGLGTGVNALGSPRQTEFGLMLTF